MADQSIELAAYDPTWQTRFAEQQMRLDTILKPWLAGEIEHIGSTSVPGLRSKPIVDILVPMRFLTASRAAIPILQGGGFTGSRRPDLTRRKAMPRLTLRIDFDVDRAIGPGKIQLLELIDKYGSISEAGRQMGMAYRRAWILVDKLNHCFRGPVVAAQAGGKDGGGAALTEFGHAVVQHYRAVESAAVRAGAAHIKALSMALAEPTAADETAAMKPRSVARGGG
jgi:molybdate transport system regulatory protein